MDWFAEIGEAIRKTSQAYGEAMTAMLRVLAETLQKPGAESNSKVVEQWLRMARMSKDGFITAIDRGFELLEKEVRRTMKQGSAAGSSSASGSEAGDSLAAWLENWKTAGENFKAALKSGALEDQLRKQAEAAQKTFSDAVKVWQQLWQDATKKSG